MAESGLRERKNARTQLAIERAALELAIEQGYRQTTVDQIAERADVSPRTVYVRYKTKDAIVSRDADVSSAALAEALDAGSGDLLDRIGDVLRASLDGSDDDELADLRYRATFEDPYLRALVARQIDASIPVFKHQITKELGLAADDVRVHVFATALTGLLTAIAERAATDRHAGRLTDDLDAGLAYLAAPYKALRRRVT